MITREIYIKRLRDKEVLNFFWDLEGVYGKTFIKIQLNKKDSRICWQRFASKDKRSWVKWNEYLTLKEVVRLIERKGK
jgi:hypothetical protein